MNNTTGILLEVFSSTSGLEEFYANITIDGPPPRWQTWIYGFAAVSACSYAAPLGVLLLPFLNKRLYERTMIFLIALGIGAISSNALFIMIPQAFSLNILEGLLYRSKSATILAAIYTFLTVDRVLQIALALRRRPEDPRQSSNSEKMAGNGVMITNGETGREKEDDLTERLENAMLNNLTWGKLVLGPVDDIEFKDHNGKTIPIRRKLGHLGPGSGHKVSSTDSNKEFELIDHGAGKFGKNEDELSVDLTIIEPVSHQIVSVAYMLIIGSTANNFVDGMSMGAAFSDNIMRGVSIGIAVFSQQFPQEIGTLAIIIKGIGLKKALLLNTIPIVLSYIGFAVGVILDTLDDSYGSYIFAISAGMYLYIFLGTLVPEMRETTNVLVKQDLKESLLVTVLQIAGIFAGVALMAFMSSISELDLN